MKPTLYSAWRASAPYRVRIGLALKGVDFDYAPLNLIRGDQREPAYRAVNAQGLTPALVLEDGTVLAQSLSILEWLEESIPEPALLPRAPLDRAMVRRMALIVACDIHPLNNTRVGRRLTSEMGHSEAEVTDWIRHWIGEGFDALEPLVAAHSKGFAFGETPTLADCCLVPQVYNSQRFGLDLSPYPAIRAVAERAVEHPAFKAAHPNNQPDAVPA
jgi:maleylacetoacetate isomerase/maleylpyruvate isomerase